MTELSTAHVQKPVDWRWLVGALSQNPSLGTLIFRPFSMPPLVH